MAVFMSYSSRDRALVESVLKALRRAHEQVWLDEELGGGEAWWREILEQIRGCEVFLVALSKNMLDSKACAAELRYAQQLGKPVLPVQVGDLDNMRINPLAAMQVIDFRRPSIDSGIELVSSVHALRARAKPLPDPLPEEPLIPFAYLMRLATTISDPAPLSAQQQMTLVAELKAGLDEDGDDLSARRDIAQLLSMLRDRPDVTWRTRNEVESVLASLTATEPVAATGASPAYGPGAPHYITGPQPAYSDTPTGPPLDGGPGPYQRFAPTGGGPPGGGAAAKTSKARTKWLIAGGVGAVVVAVVAVVVIVAVNGSGSEPTPQPPTLAPNELNSLLLTTNEVESVVGVTNLSPGEVYDEMASNPVTVSEPDCAGAQYNALQTVYAGSGYSAVADQQLTAQEPKYVFVNQSVVLFPSQDHAQRFVTNSADEWEACSGRNMTVTLDNGDTYNWTFGDAERKESQISQHASQEGMEGYGCDHVLRVVSNAVLEVRACRDNVTDDGSRMADQMAAKVSA